MSELQSIPSALRIEETVIGALLVDSSSIAEGMLLLKSSDIFYEEKYRLIFEAIEDLHASNEAVDVATVANKLRFRKTLDKSGGEYELIMISQKVGSGAHIEHHCRILLEFWLKRKLIKKAEQIRFKAFQDDVDPFELLETDARMNDELNEFLFSGATNKSYSTALDEVEKRVEMLSGQKEGEFTGAPTGFKKLDKFTNGWQPSDLIIVAARPGMGKTAFALKTFVECGKKGFAAGFFSLEMSINQLAARTVAIDSNFHLSQLIRDGFEKDKYFITLRMKKDEMSKYPLYIDDTPSQDIRDIISKARIWKRKHDIKILILDYIQLATDKSKGNNREQEISSISRSLKMLAKELNIPVIALSQLSRQVESRTDKHPKLSDLRESGAIEQDADIVTFLYREHYYNPGAALPEELVQIGANAEFAFAKYREGSLETKGLFFDANKVKYMDPEEYEETEYEDSLPKLDPNDDNPF